MHRILDAVAVEYLEGTSLMNVYCRMMGAKIGKGAYFGSFNIGAFDLVTIGDETHLGDATTLLGYTMEDGMLKLGPVAIGKRCFVGAGSVLRPDTVMQDDSRLLHMPACSERRNHHERRNMVRIAGRKNCTIPPHFPKGPESRPPGRASPEKLVRRPARNRRFSAARGLSGGALFPGLVLLNSLAVDYGEVWSLLAAPAVGVTFIVLLCLEIIVVKWLLLGKVKPGDYPIHGWFYLRKWFVDQLMGLSLDIMGPLYATLYLNPWYKSLGAKMGRRGGDFHGMCCVARLAGDRRGVLHRRRRDAGRAAN